MMIQVVIQGFWKSGKEKRMSSEINIGAVVRIRMDLEEIGINAENWVDLAQDRDYW